LGKREAEMKVAPALLDQLPLEGLVVTMDALHTQRQMARKIVARGGDYFMVVKGNQPTLYRSIELLYTDPPPGENFARALSRARRGDRWEERELEASPALGGYLKWPHVGQVCRVERRVSRKGRTRREVSYAVTSLGPDRADPKRLQRLWRGHWSIENRLHWVRDVTLGEDGSQVRKGSAPPLIRRFVWAPCPFSAPRRAKAGLDVITRWVKPPSGRLLPWL